MVEKCTICLHNSYTARNRYVICNKNRMIQNLYHPLRMTHFHRKRAVFDDREVCRGSSGAERLYGIRRNGVWLFGNNDPGDKIGQCTGSAQTDKGSNDANDGHVPSIPNGKSCADPSDHSVVSWTDEMVDGKRWWD